VASAALNGDRACEDPVKQQFGYDEDLVVFMSDERVA
jgi:hypothetical protein